LKKNHIGETWNPRETPRTPLEPPWNSLEIPGTPWNPWKEQKIGKLKILKFGQKIRDSFHGARNLNFLSSAMISGLKIYLTLYIQGVQTPF